MLKGQVFKEQIFESQVFAVFINTFLAGKNGIINGYKNSMKPTAGNNSITIQNGVICIQGRFLEEDTETTLDTGTDTAFCKLVIEIDLDKVNTEIDFTQGYYKIVKGASDYPSLTQDDIINTNSGVYQYELARFKTTLNGISDFVDMRSYLDFNSIYSEIENKIKEIEDGSIYALKTDFTDFKTEIQEEMTDFLEEAEEIADKATNYKDFVTFTHTYDFNLSPGGTINGSQSISNEGYYPLGIIGVGNSKRTAELKSYVLTSKSEGAATIDYSLINRDAGNVVIGTIQFQILWVKVK